MTQSSGPGYLVLAVIGAAAWLVLLASPVAAGTFEIAPTTIFLSHGARTATFYVTNRDTGPIMIQTEGFVWQKADSADALSASDNISVSPPIVRIPPGQRQTVRIALGTDSTPQERAFRLHIGELPDPERATTSEVRIMLNFDIPIFVAAAQRRPNDVKWSAIRTANGITIQANNEGSSHIRLSGLEVGLSSGEHLKVGQKPFAYILAGQSRTWFIEAGAALTNNSEVHIFGHDDTSGGMIDNIARIIG